MDEKPMPTELFHNCFGPEDGQVVDQPLSFEMPLSSGPRQRCQSSPAAFSACVRGEKRSQESETSCRAFMRETVVGAFAVSIRRTSEQLGFNPISELSSANKRRRTQSSAARSEGGARSDWGFLNAFPFHRVRVFPGHCPGFRVQGQAAFARSTTRMCRSITGCHPVTVTEWEEMLRTNGPWNEREL